MVLTEKRLIPPPKPSKECSSELFNLFWPECPPDVVVSDDHAYFSCRVLGTLESLKLYEAKYAAKKFEDIQMIITTVRDYPHSTQETVVHEMKEHFNTFGDADILRSLDLVLQLWLGLNFCSTTPFGLTDPWNSRIKWKEDETLQNLVAARFHKLQRPAAASINLDATFTAAKLTHMRKLKIRWTWNLIDHLKLDGRRGERTLSVYQHKVCLVKHSQTSQTIISADILIETLRTLNILFPVGDPSTEILLEKEGIPMHSVRADTDGDRPQSTTELVYWRSRVEELHKLFHDPPETFTQAIYDIRNPHQWATMWIAIFGIFLLTLIFGIMATVYAVEQYKIARKSYDLSVAVACRQKTGPLPGFC